MKARSLVSLALGLALAASSMTACSSAPASSSKAQSAPSSSAPASSVAETPATTDYPKKPVQVIIPYAPGGGSDILTRAIMKYIKLPNDQNLVAINVEGAAGYIGCQQAATSSNDGYTILAHNPMDVVSYTLNGTAPDALWSEMEMICGVVDDFNVISTNKQSGWKTIDEAVAYIKAHPDEVKWGTTGAQNVNYGDTLRVLEALGIKDDVTLVPYDGGSASKTALMGNHIQMETNSSSDIRSSVASGDTIPLMVIGDRRAKALPEIQCTQELGYDITTTKPRGYYAPKDTDPAVINVLADAIEEVTKNEEFIKSVEDLGLEVNFVRGDEMQIKVSKWADTLYPVFEEMMGTESSSK